MAKMNVWKPMFPVRTHEGAVAQKVDAKSELRRTMLTCLLWEDTFYEKGNDIAKRIAALAAENKPEVVAALAREARGKMQLRHAPLFLTRELARRKGIGRLVAETLEDVIQRADELGEFVALYWKEKKQPLSAGVKRGLARAFTKFDAYQLAKYDRESAVKLRDVLFLCHAKPKDQAQAVLWKKLVENTLEPPDTWEVALSTGKDKRENFERLLREGKLGGLAVLRNLRLMLASGVDPKLVRERLDQGVARALPFRFVTAARYAPRLEDALEKAMLKGIAGFAKLARVHHRDLLRHLHRIASATGLRVARCHGGLAGALGNLPQARADAAPRQGGVARTRSANRNYRRTVARRHPASVDAARVRGERGPVQTRHQLRQRLDAR